MNPEDSALISQVADQKFGSAPGAPAAPAAPAETPPTAQEAVSANAAPNTEADAMSADAATEISEDDLMKMIEVDFGEGNKRNLTPTQIAGTFKRYGELNHKHASMKPVLDFASQIMQNAKAQGQDIKAEDVVAYLQNAAQAFAKNPQMGGDNTNLPAGGPKNIPLNAQEQAGNVDPNQFADALTRWEEENGVELPPGYKDSMSNMAQLQQQNAQLIQAVQQLLQGSQATVQLANQQAQAADVSQVESLRGMAANNLNRAQQQLQVPDEAEPAFFEFAYQRGYTMEDFVDPQITMTIMQDFKNSMNSPEFDRLKAIAQRRQAYSGSVDGSPAGGAAPAQQQGDPTFNAMVDTVIDNRQKRNM